MPDELIDPSLAQEFQAESKEHLERIEDDLIWLEASPETMDMDRINRIFRAIHSVKGTSGFLGFQTIGALSHAMETLLDHLRKGKLKASPPLVSELLKGVDDLRAMLDDLLNSNQRDISARVADLDRWLHVQPEVPPGSPPAAAPADTPLVPSLIEAWAAAPAECSSHWRILIPDLHNWQRLNNMTPLALFARLEERGFVVEAKLKPMTDRLNAGIEQAALGLELLYATTLTREEVGTAFAIPATLIEPAGAAPATAQPPPAVPQVAEAVPATAGNRYTIRFAPAAEVTATPKALDSLWDDLRRLGPCRIEPDSPAAPTQWTITLDTAATEPEIRDAFIFVEKGGGLEINRADQADPTDPPGQPPLAGPAAAAPAEPAPETTAGPTPAAVDLVRVPADKLDRLVNLVGELVIQQAQLRAATSRVAHLAPEFQATIEGLERLHAELRDVALNIRMMPIGATFNKYRRLVRDLCQEFGKEVDLVIEGADTELDKTVIDQLGDPLLHLVRNCLDHGLEPPEARIRQGKPRAGRLRLAADHQGDRVVITVADDGKGLDAAAIRGKAVERGLIPADASMSEAELHNLIFLPGFSTAQKVTSVSGRGVGMDVVKRQIDLLRGAVELQSQPGRGTSFRLSLPLTLAIIEGLMVEVDNERFILPLGMVTETIELTRAQRLDDNARNAVAVRGALVPYLRLRDLFGFPDGDAPLERVVIVNLEDRRLGLVVDRVLGNHQTVLKTMGRMFQGVTIFSGATILGDGAVALILDVPSLLRHSRAKVGESAMLEV